MLVSNVVRVQSIRSAVGSFVDLGQKTKQLLAKFGHQVGSKRLQLRRVTLDTLLDNSRNSIAVHFVGQLQQFLHRLHNNRSQCLFKLVKRQERLDRTGSFELHRKTVVLVETRKHAIEKHRQIVWVLKLQGIEFGSHVTGTCSEECILGLEVWQDIAGQERLYLVSKRLGSHESAGDLAHNPQNRLFLLGNILRLGQF
ncbi:hypothetical protein OGAPHI_007410 [Ogataea philodendri]|uniref:Uncharacterized protein n=1 Tax=Ogataea philodendri TaxID=1378263 RepID=A0A9P8NVB1_9ASCO|nr:uncharacterized protein OGAPHI_007410 [Ogataea philodendri]KAH3660205.1 hypothetical protein OGAPHI_007410 [Ogataea philodendri]